MNLNSNQTPFSLKPHQQEAVKQITTALQSTSKALVEVATGGGKTIISAELAQRHLQSGNGSVLVISKNWDIVIQHIHIFNRHISSLPRSRFIRLGGSTYALNTLNDLSMIPPRSRKKPSITFTTLPTFYKRLETHSALLKKFNFGLVIWDECHWADGQRMGDRLIKWSDSRRAKSRRVKLVGLSATPKCCEVSGFDKPVFIKDLNSLIEEGLLAQPIVTQVDTSFNWSAHLDTTEGDYTPASLAALNHPKRNAKICDHYLSERGRYRRTIIFCTNIAHADALATLMARRYIPAGLLHHKIPKKVQADMISKFKRGSIEVLINVMMLVHGIDIPEVDTLFMTRPTRSKRLYLQMIGRGVRKQSDEFETFHIVEFTDNLTRHGLSPIEWSFNTKTFRPIPYKSQQRRRYKPNKKIEEHTFDPNSTPERLGSAVYPFMEDHEYLWFMNNQTFGVELELTSNHWFCFPDTQQWKEKSQHLLDALQRALPPHLVADVPKSYHKGSHHQWNVEWDSTAGWEVTSRILQGYHGFLELGIACEALEQAAKEVGLRVNARTGFHLHLGWIFDLNSIKSLLLLMHHLEPFLSTLVAPSRIAKYSITSHEYDTRRANPYCAPLSSVLDINKVMKMQSKAELQSYLSYTSRGTTLNLKPLFTYGSVEFRLHSGTLNIHKILLWTSLCQQILQASRTPLINFNHLSRGLKRRTVITPTLGLESELRALLPDGTNLQFLEHITRRKMEHITRISEIPSLSRYWKHHR